MFSKKNKITNLNIVEMTDFAKKSIPSIIVSDLNIQGDLVSEGAIEIGGKVKGNVLCDHVTIRRGAEITGDIKSKQLIIHGLVKGEISSEHLSITSSGKVRGTIEYGYMSVESGADIECNCKKIIFETIQQVDDQEFIPKIENVLNGNKVEKEILEDSIIANDSEKSKEEEKKYSSNKNKRKKK